jgi:hypothetical protein
MRQQHDILAIQFQKHEMEIRIQKQKSSRSGSEWEWGKFWPEKWMARIQTDTSARVVHLLLTLLSIQPNDTYHRIIGCKEDIPTQTEDWPHVVFYFIVNRHIVAPKPAATNEPATHSSM